jgi:phage shock protein C
MKKPLARSRNNSMIASICGGFAEFVGWDPTLVRLLYVLISIFFRSVPGHPLLHPGLAHYPQGIR